jgi:type I restriction enzyme M protein
MRVSEGRIEQELIETLASLKYEHRADIHGLEALEANFREKFEALNHVRLSGVEARIREKLLVDGHIDTVIGLPANLFYSTGIPVCILVLKKCKKPDDVLFINAAEHFVKDKRQNRLDQAHIDRIVETYRHRTEQDRYSRRVAMREIVENEYNLNISRYVSTAEDETEIDLAATHAELVRIEGALIAATKRHNAFLKELGLPLLPVCESDS